MAPVSRPSSDASWNDAWAHRSGLAAPHRFDTRWLLACTLRRHAHSPCRGDSCCIGFAALQVNTDLGLNPAVYGFGTGIFFIGYVLFDVPSVRCRSLGVAGLKRVRRSRRRPPLALELPKDLQLRETDGLLDIRCRGESVVGA